MAWRQCRKRKSGCVFFLFLSSNVLLNFSCPCQPPDLYQPRDLINIPAIVEPHQGTSYNPPVDAHQELLLKAVAVEEKRLKGVEKLAAVKAKMDSALRETDGLDNLGAAGMTITTEIDGENAQEEEGEEGDGQGSYLPRKFANPKTKAQKNKAARVLAEVRLFFPTFFSWILIHERFPLETSSNTTSRT